MYLYYRLHNLIHNLFSFVRSFYVPVLHCQILDKTGLLLSTIICSNMASLTFRARQHDEICHRLTVGLLVTTVLLEWWITQKQFNLKPKVISSSIPFLFCFVIISEHGAWHSKHWWDCCVHAHRFDNTWDNVTLLVSIASTTCGLFLIHVDQIFFSILGERGWTKTTKIQPKHYTTVLWGDWMR